MPHKSFAVGAKLIAVLSAGVLMTSMGLAPANAAKAEVPDTAALAGDLSEQEIVWESADKCEYGEEQLNERYRPENLQCATIKVPKDWKDAKNGETWDVRISLAKNVDFTSPNYKGTIFSNPGGPGGEGLVYAAATQERTPELNSSYNYVGFDPRGVGQSSRVDCAVPSKEPADKAKACSENPDIRTINTEQTAYDMDFVRSLLGAPKLSYIGYSYGTWLGSWYSKIFGDTYGDKFLLDSATDVTQKSLQLTWDMQPVARDRQFNERMTAWIARHDDTYKMGTDPEAIGADITNALAEADEVRNTFWGLTAGSSFSTNSNYPLVPEVYKVMSDPDTEFGALLGIIVGINPWTPAAEKLKSRVDPKYHSMIDRSINGAMTKVQENLRSGLKLDVFEVIRCNDGQWNQDIDYWEEANKKSDAENPLSAAMTNGAKVPVCAYWKAPTQMPVADPANYPDTIVVQGELDSQTAWETGRTSGVKLPNTSFIAVDNEGSHGLFPYGVDAVDRPIIDFFLTGKQPKDISVSQAAPLPMEEFTFKYGKKIDKSANLVGDDPVDIWQRASGFSSSQPAVDEESRILDEDLIVKEQVDRLLENKEFDKYRR